MSISAQGLSIFCNFRSKKTGDKPLADSFFQGLKEALQVIRTHIYYIEIYILLPVVRNDNLTTQVLLAAKMDKIGTGLVGCETELTHLCHPD